MVKIPLKAVGYLIQKDNNYGSRRFFLSRCTIDLIERFIGLESPRWLSPETGDDRHEDYHRKKRRIENIRFDHGHGGDQSCVGGSQTSGSGRRVRVDASRCQASCRVEEASRAGTTPSRFKDRTESLEESRAMGY